MQTLFVKQPGGGTKEVKIHRSWQDAGGSAIFLHVNGRYAHKDGQPLKRREDLDILPAAQRKHAHHWWHVVGAAESAKYYKRQEAEAEAEAGDFRDVLVESTELDAALYTRKKAKGGAVSAPKAWMEFFEKRPDWWGQARLIEFGDYVYELAVLEDQAKSEEEAPPPEPGSKAAKAAAARAAKVERRAANPDEPGEPSGDEGEE